MNYWVIEAMILLSPPSPPEGGYFIKEYRIFLLEKYDDTFPPTPKGV